MLLSQSILFAEINLCFLITPTGTTWHRLDPPDAALRTGRHGVLHLGHRVVLQDGVSDGEGNDTEPVEGEDLSGGADSEVLAGQMARGDMLREEHRPREGGGERRGKKV